MVRVIHCAPVLPISAAVRRSYLMSVSQPLHTSCSSLLVSPFPLYTFCPSSLVLYVASVLNCWNSCLPFFSASFFQDRLWGLHCCMVPSCVRPSSPIFLSLLCSSLRALLFFTHVLTLHYHCLIFILCLMFKVFHFLTAIPCFPILAAFLYFVYISMASSLQCLLCQRWRSSGKLSSVSVERRAENGERKYLTLLGNFRTRNAYDLGIYR